MAYTLSYSGGTITVNDGTVNTDTSLQLPGRNFSGYGTFIDQNLVTMMQNFASATNPSNSIRGQLWFDTGSNKLKYNISPTKGSPEWIEIAGSGSGINPTFGTVTAAAIISNTINSGSTSTPGTITGQWSLTSNSSITSPTYTFSSGYNIYRETSPAPAIRMTINGDNANHYFYEDRYVAYGETVGDPSEIATFAVIVGIDDGTIGGGGVAGVCTTANTGLGYGVGGAAINPAFSGVIIYSAAAQNASNNFNHIACLNYPSVGSPGPVFKVSGAGYVTADGTFSSPAADYAEYFEWVDGNPGAEDRVGYSVSLVGNKIKIAESGETVIGVVSAFPAFVGDAGELHWQGKYETDEWGRIVTENYTVFQWTDDDGRTKSVASYDDTSGVPVGAIEITTGKDNIPLSRYKLSSSYNPNQPYVPRNERPEWSTIGLMGKLRVRKGQVVDPRWIKMRDIDANIEEYLVR